MRGAAGPRTLHHSRLVSCPAAARRGGQRLRGIDRRGNFVALAIDRAFAARRAYYRRDHQRNERAGGQRGQTARIHGRESQHKSASAPPPGHLFRRLDSKSRSHHGRAPRPPSVRPQSDHPGPPRGRFPTPAPAAPHSAPSSFFARVCRVMPRYCAASVLLPEHSASTRRTCTASSSARLGMPTSGVVLACSAPCGLSGVASAALMISSRQMDRPQRRLVVHQRRPADDRA